MDIIPPDSILLQKYSFNFFSKDIFYHFYINSPQLSSIIRPGSKQGGVKMAGLALAQCITMMVEMGMRGQELASHIQHMLSMTM
jgi:hypothetical protein